MKRISLLTMMCLLACLGAWAVEVEIDGINYDVNTEERTATVIKKESKYEGEVVIPSSIMVEGMECAVTGIGIRAFSDCAELTSIAIPPSITFIRQNAFFQTGLTSVHIEDLKAWCKLSFELSYSNPLIEAHHLYLNGQEVKDLVIPEGITDIGAYAFVDCTSLTSVTFPSSVSGIGHGAFYGCTELHSLKFSEGITSIGAYAFCGCSALTSLMIPSSVTIISDGAFNSCKGIKSITIPSRVTSIGSSAFSYCAELADVYCYARTVPTTEGSVFEETSFENATLHVPASAIEAYKASEPWSKFGMIEELDESITDYRPFIEEGKVWKEVQMLAFTNIPDKEHYKFFDGDTIIDERVCKKMYMADTPFEKQQRIYVGAWYEENKQVFFARQYTDHLILFYDFNLSVGEEFEMQTIYQDYMLKGIVANIHYDGDDFSKMTALEIAPLHDFHNGQEAYDYEDPLLWRVGVGGYQVNDNAPEGAMVGGNIQTAACYVGDEVIFYDAALTNTDSDVKKNWLDFTHTVKTKPKAPSMNGKWTARPNGTLDPSRMDNGALGPARRSATLDPSRTGRLTPQECSATSDEETVTGEYSVKELFVNFKTLAGPYTITVTDAAGQPIYNKVVQTSNVVALNTDISTYPKGSYTIMVENEEEMYTAEFNIKDEDSLTPNPSPVGEGNYVGEGEAGAVYDLSGRRIVNHKSETLPLGGVGGGFSKGIYIIDGRKVVIH